MEALVVEGESVPAVVFPGLPVYNVRPLRAHRLVTKSFSNFFLKKYVVFRLTLHKITRP